MHEVLVNRLGGLSLPRKSVVRITDRPDMTLDVYHGRKTTIQQPTYSSILFKCSLSKRVQRVFLLRWDKYNRSPMQTEKFQTKDKRIMP